jgi:hypothetical protein
MIDDEQLYKVIYDEILGWLRSNGAEALAVDIEKTVSRGVILSEQRTTYSQQSKILRPMANQEMLAVLLESLIAALEVPLMLEEAKIVLGCESISWLPITPGLEAEAAVLDRAMAVKKQELQNELGNVLSLIQEIGIKHPEVA